MCANCAAGAGPDYTAAVMMQIYTVTGAIFLSIFLYAGIAAVLTQSASMRATPNAAEWLPAMLVGIGVVTMAASAYASFAAVRARGPRAMVRGVIFAAALAETPAILGLLATVLTLRLAWIAWGIGLALVAFMALAFQMPAIAHAVGEWARKEREQ
jgi:nicotinamide riboside transporter PnuC